MSTVEEIKSAISKLSIQEMEEVRDWLEDLIEDQLVVSDGFEVKIERAEKEIAAGNYSRVKRLELGT
jgi:hypothetical protein